MLTATFNSYGDRQISTPLKINNPEPIYKKSAQLITSARGPPIPNLIEIHSLKYNKNYFLFIYLYLFFFDQPTGQTRGWIFTRDSSNDVKSLKDVPFGVIKLNINFEPLFIPQNRQILAQNGTENA